MPKASRATGLVPLRMKSSDVTISVSAGLAVGIAFVLLFAIFFGQSIGPLSSSATLKFKPGQFKEQAVKIALQNSTLRNLYEGREPVVMFYRDHGVGHDLYDCVPTCAIISFTDPASPVGGSADVIVNPVLGKVFEVRVSYNLLIAKTQEIPEVRTFLSRYPDAEVTVEPGLGNSLVLYEIQTNAKLLALAAKTTPDGKLLHIYAECNLAGEALIVTSNISSFIESTDCLVDSK